MPSKSLTYGYCGPSQRPAQCEGALAGTVILIPDEHSANQGGSIPSIFGVLWSRQHVHG